MRCSGPQARAIAGRVFRARSPLADRMAVYGDALDVHGGVLDSCLALAMDGPRTATGEDVVEYHVHGSPVIAREMLRSLLHAGARAAGPGEFTRRAFLNGKLDLSAAEAVADAVDAESRAAVRAAHANLAGALRTSVERVRDGLRVLVEELAGAIDYPDEVPEPPRDETERRLSALAAELDALVGDWERGRITREGLSLAIVGPPNAGKSSLLNALLGEARAIVTDIAGTTRDVIEERFTIGGVAVRVLDTAGLRASHDPIERIGIERARAALDAATLALVVVDGSLPLDIDARDILRATRDRARIVLFNKRDAGAAGYDAREPAEHDAISGSTRDAATLDAVRDAVAARGWGGETVDLARAHLASARQADAVARAIDAIGLAAETVWTGQALDLAAPDLVGAIAALGEITGASATEEILAGVFARFCIGK